MTTSEIRGSSEAERSTTRWVRRSVMATAFVAAGVLTLGAVTAPAQAQYYGGYPYSYSPIYQPYYGYGYGYPSFGVGVGWGGGGRGGWGGHGGGGHGGGGHGGGGHH